MIGRLSFLLILVNAIVFAQLRECPGISADGYKIIVDNIGVVGSGGQESALLLSHLQQKLQFDLATLQLETDPPMILIPCQDRVPQDPSDFSTSVIDSLNGHRVLVEIWGRIEARVGASTQRARLNFTLVPISYYDHSLVPLGGFTTAYERRLRVTPEELMKMFGEFSDLKTYITIAAGVKSLKEHDYDQAFLCFCRGKSLLGQLPVGIGSAVRTSLAAYVDQKVHETFTQAHGDTGVRSALALDGTRPVCPGALP